MQQPCGITLFRLMLLMFPKTHVGMLWEHEAVGSNPTTPTIPDIFSYDEGRVPAPPLPATRWEPRPVCFQTLISLPASSRSQQ